MLYRQLPLRREGARLAPTGRFHLAVYLFLAVATASMFAVEYAGVKAAPGNDDDMWYRIAIPVAIGGGLQAPTPVAVASPTATLVPAPTRVRRDPAPRPRPTSIYLVPNESVYSGCTQVREVFVGESDAPDLVEITRHDEYGNAVSKSVDIANDGLVDHLTRSYYNTNGELVLVEILLSGSAEPAAVYEYEYSLHGEPIVCHVDSDGDRVVDYRRVWGYDQAGYIVSDESPRRVVVYGYDQVGRHTSTLSNETADMDDDWDSLDEFLWRDELITLRRFDRSADGVVDAEFEYWYDFRRRLTRWESIVGTWEVAYNPVGYPVQAKRYLGGGLESVEEYAYDVLGRRVTYRISDQTGVPERWVYTYDCTRRADNGTGRSGVYEAYRPR